MSLSVVGQLLFQLHLIWDAPASLDLKLSVILFGFQTLLGYSKRSWLKSSLLFIFINFDPVLGFYELAQHLGATTWSLIIALWSCPLIRVCLKRELLDPSEHPSLQKMSVNTTRSLRHLRVFQKGGYFLWVEAIAKPFGFNICHSGGTGETAKWLSKSFSLDSSLILKISAWSYLEMF